MTDNINPSHYKDGPFECIELSRLLSSDWGQAVQYCFRWQHKNGVEDLKKALWFVNDALVHGIPIYAVSDWADLASALFHTLAREDWAGLKSVSRRRSVRLLRRNDDGLRACNQLLPSHARLFRHHAFRGTQSKRGREGIVMWFKRRRNEYGCPMCGRLPVIKASQTEKYHESRKVRTTLTVYRLQCPRGHISTSWFSHAALASRQWKELVDEYKGKDTK